MESITYQGVRHSMYAPMSGQTASASDMLWCTLWARYTFLCTSSTMTQYSGGLMSGMGNPVISQYIIKT